MHTIFGTTKAKFGILKYIVDSGTRIAFNNARIRETDRKNKITIKKSNRARASFSIRQKDGTRKNPVKRQISAYWLYLKVRL